MAGAGVQATAPAQAEASGARADVASVPAPDGAEQRAELDYEAAYYYSVACLAGLAGDVRDQEALLERAQAADPSSALLARERGDALSTLGRKDEAAELLRQALARTPKDLELRRQLGRLYTDADHPALARALFLKPDGRDPSDPDFLRSLVGIDFVQQDYPSAVRRLRVLLRKGGTQGDHELLALALQRLLRWREAAGEYRAVLRSESGSAETWESLADCDEAAGDTASARTDLKAGLKAYADSPLLADQLGRLLYRTRDYVGAERVFSSLVAVDPSDTHSLLYRGLARLKSGRYREAEADFRVLGGLDHDDPDQGYALALALLMQKKYPEARTQLLQVLALDPQAEEAWGQLAYVDERQQRPQQAVLDLTQGLKAMPDSQELALLLAEVHEDLKDLPAAEGTLRDALRRGGGDEVRFQLAVILDKQGKFPDAEHELGVLIAESPRHAEALNYLGYSWADRGEKLAQAEALIRRALAEEPGNRFYLDSLGWTLYKEGRAKDALGPLTQAAKGVGATADSNEAVIFDHLEAVQKKLGRPESARRSRAQAEKMRARPAADSAAAAPGEPDL
jgi:tetratricopeptide (TPR) repeat protein